MMHSKQREEMQRLASTYAQRPDLVQGAGGNISVKIEKGLMLIKASGREFLEITERQGLVSVFYDKLKEYLLHDSSLTADERTHLETVRMYTDQGNEKDRPSMEVWFHTLLRDYVLHTHSVYVNILSCSQEGSEIFKAIMEKNNLSFHLFPYYNPGFELGKAMAGQFKTLGYTPDIIFLENHGIIVNADSAQSCADLHEFVEEKIKEELDIEDTPFDMSELKEKDRTDFDSLVLFPDQIIYPQHPAIRAAHRFILRRGEARGLHPRPIEEASVSTVQNMESEKHRKNFKK